MRSQHPTDVDAENIYTIGNHSLTDKTGEANLNIIYAEQVTYQNKTGTKDDKGCHMIDANENYQLTER